MSEKKSPFKFLDYYNRKDTAIFFGREDEETKVYQLVRKNRFVLIYGPSGSGKTSLVLCGLSKQFDPSEWIPIYIRRGNNINISFLNELKSKYELDVNPYDLKNAVAQLKRMIEGIRVRDLRPIYLIFDQFEELLILGNERERNTFKELLREIAEDESLVSTHVVILLREEYFAWLDSFEQDIIGISDNRLRVEAMRMDEIKRVIKKSCAAFHITLENEDRITSQIINALSGKNAISLPYLQVYLDQLWKTVDANHPNATRKNGFPELTFSLKEINAFGNFKDVLFRFLKQQTEKVQKELLQEFPGEAEDCIPNILDSFVTLEGTKLPISYSHIRNAYKLDNKAPNYLQSLKPRVLKFALDKLEDNRILRDDGATFELAHDALSKLIDSQRDSNHRRANEIRMEIQKAFESWTKDPKEFLSYKKVKEYETFIPSLNLEKPQLEFYNLSKESREDEELERVKSIRKFNRLRIGVSLLVLLVAVGLIIGNELLNRANSDFALVNMAYNIEPISKKETALQLAKYIYDYKDYNSSDAQNLQTKIIRIALDQSIQSKFASMPAIVLHNKVFAPGESDISSDGKHLFVKDDYIKIYSGSNLDTTFLDFTYGYFLNRPNLLLLAGISSEKSAQGKTIPNFSNRFVIYDCSKRKFTDTVDLSSKEGYLYNPDVVFGEDERSNYSFRVLVTNDSNLVIPFLQYNSGDFLGHRIGKTFMAKKITYKEAGRKDLLDIIASDHPISYSAYTNKIIVFKGPYSKGSLSKLSDIGTIEETFENAQFGTFTNRGNMLYISDGRLFLRGAAQISSIFIDKGIDAAYAETGDYAIASSKSERFYVANFSTGNTKSTRGELVGVDFKMKRVVYKKPTVANAFFLQSFSGKLIDSFICTKDVESFVYNIDSNSILALTKKDDITTYQHLYLLDRNLKARAAFGLTANDAYGFSKDGSSFYYLRDNYLTVFGNKKSLVNLLSFDKLNEWMDEKVDCPRRDTLRKYGVVFPKQKISRLVGISGSKRCDD